jgi:hypothetical protein
MEFTSDEGRTWQTVADGIEAGRPVRWTVPRVNSRTCRLRIIGVRMREIDRPDGGLKEIEDYVMLARTRRFEVDTVLPDTEMGPENVPDRDHPRPRPGD